MIPEKSQQRVTFPPYNDGYMVGGTSGEGHCMGLNTPEGFIQGTTCMRENGKEQEKAERAIRLPCRPDAGRQGGVEVPLMPAV